MHGSPWTYDPRAPQDGRVSYVSDDASGLLTTQNLKDHLRINHTDEDPYLDSLLEVAQDELDMPRAVGTPPGWLGRSLIKRTLLLTLDAVPPPVVFLPGSPVVSVVKVEFRGADDVITLIPNTDYITDLVAEPALLWPDVDWPFAPSAWPSVMKGGPDTFRVTYVAGYADAAAVPALIKQWVLVRAAELYRDREGTVIGTINTTLKHIERMLDAYRVRI